MTPQTLDEVENLHTKRLLWKLGASGLGACRRIVRDALEALPQKYPHSTQVRAYEVEKGRLTMLLASIGE